MTVFMPGWADTLKELAVIIVAVGTVIFFCSRIAEENRKIKEETDGNREG